MSMWNKQGGMEEEPEYRRCVKGEGGGGGGGPGLELQACVKYIYEISRQRLITAVHRDIETSCALYGWYLIWHVTLLTLQMD